MRLDTLDGRPFYDLATAVKLIGGLSPEARRAYVRVACGDLVFIALYVPVLTRLLPASRLRWRALAAAPLVTGACDLLETVTILLALLGKLPLEALRVCVIATPLKWAGACACLLALLTKRGGGPHKG